MRLKHIIIIIVTLLVLIGRYQKGLNKFFSGHSKATSQTTTNQGVSKELDTTIETALPKSRFDQFGTLAEASAKALAAEKAKEIAQATEATTEAGKDAQADATGTAMTPERVAKMELKRLLGNKIKNVFRLPKQVKLNPKQKEKLVDVVKKYAPKLEEHIAKMESVLNDDQRNARNEALVRAAFDKVTPDERKTAIKSAMNLSSEQRTTLSQMEKQYTAMKNFVRKEMTQYMTKPQKASLPPTWIASVKGRS